MDFFPSHFILFVAYALSQPACPDMHFKLNHQFLLEKYFCHSQTSTAPARLGSRTRGVQTLNSLKILYYCLYTLLYDDCPVSRYTVQDKPLFVVTTIQNRISQTVCTSMEHTIELDILMENTNSFLVVWRHPSDKNNDYGGVLFFSIFLSYCMR